MLLDQEAREKLNAKGFDDATLDALIHLLDLRENLIVTYSDGFNEASLLAIANNSPLFRDRLIDFISPADTKDKKGTFVAHLWAMVFTIPLAILFI